jgi:transcriptional regulator with XRE-family HTH domain
VPAGARVTERAGAVAASGRPRTVADVRPRVTIATRFATLRATSEPVRVTDRGEATAGGSRMAGDDDDGLSSFSVEVGQRLRGVRRLRKLSLDDVERESGGQWSASAIGAYERGFRNLSLPRLRELAEFYDVPMSVLLGESDDDDDSDRPSKVILDLVALSGIPEAEAVHRYARSIILERGDFNGRVLSIRRDDLRAICSLLHSTETQTLQQLRDWDALVETL